MLYQIFPDRFAKSVGREAPPWAIPQAWDDPVVGAGPDADNGGMHDLPTHGPAIGIWRCSDR